jgi:hypothetical protein
MERYTWVRFAGKLTSCHSTHIVKVSTPVGRWNMGVGSIRRKTHGELPRHTASSEHTIGAMEEMSGKVQNASTHPLRSYRHEHAHNSWSVQGPVQGGDGTLHMGSIRGKAHPLPRKHMATVSIPAGRWMKVQGKGRRQAHVRSRVVMDIAAFKISHSVGSDKDTTALRAKRWSA